MRRTWFVLHALLLSSGCKRAPEGSPGVAATGSAQVTPGDAEVTPGDALVADVKPRWYRTTLRSADGIEAHFLVGLPPAGSSGDALFRVGTDDLRVPAFADGERLRIPFDIHQTAVEVRTDMTGNLSGTFTATWRAWGAANLSLVGTSVASPSLTMLDTVDVVGPALAIDEPMTVWRLAMSDSGLAKLVLHQTRPGDFEGFVYVDTGNIVHLAGNARGDTAVLTGFDGTSGFRLELAFAADRKSAKGKWFAGHRFDWRETLTASRTAEFELATTARAEHRGVKIKLPDVPELQNLEPGPLVVELGASWCSTCRTAAPVLAELYRTYSPRGLRMVTLLYEFTDDRAVDLQQAELFKTTYGVTWPLAAITGSLDDFGDLVPAGVADVNPAGFPITLFVDADRTLVALHAGFAPSNDKAELERVSAKFKAHIETLLTRARGSAAR